MLRLRPAVIGEAKFSGSAAVMTAGMCVWSVLPPLPIASGGQGAVRTDQEAGITFNVPFAVAMEKGATQVEALVRADPRLTVPPGVRFTGGVYSPEGVPFAVIWTKPWPLRQDSSGQADVPDRGAVREFAALAPQAAAERLGLSSFRFDQRLLRGMGALPESGAAPDLSGWVVVQATTEGLAFVAIFAASETSARLLAEDVFSTLVVADGRRLVALAIGLMPPSARATTILAVGLAIPVAGWSYHWLRRRSKAAAAKDISPGSQV